jgi:hypothetical protein
MVRQVRVKAAYADRYLSLDSEVWYTAAAIAGFVKGTTIVRDGPRVEIRDRVLPPHHFEFRGGANRRGSWGDMLTRRTDRKFPRDKGRNRLELLQAVNRLVDGLSSTASTDAALG